jgi:hypothetical protein
MGIHLFFYDPPGGRCTDDELRDCLRGAAKGNRLDRADGESAAIDALYGEVVARHPVPAKLGEEESFWEAQPDLADRWLILELTSRAVDADAVDWILERARHHRIVAFEPSGGDIWRPDDQ